MQSTASIWMNAPPRAVFDLVSDLSLWERSLPHYRYVRILGRGSDGETHVAMSARRGRIPVFWEAVQKVDVAAQRIWFRHVRGVTRGMYVLWSFRAEGTGTRAYVDHFFDLGTPYIGGWLTERVVFREFVEPIVAKTLGCFRTIAESRAAIAPPDRAAS